MKRIAFAAFLVLAVSAGVFADNIFFPAKEGMVLTTAVLKKGKGKPKSFVRTTITNVEGSGDNIAITYSIRMLNAKQKPSFDDLPSFTQTVRFEDGYANMDLEVLATIPTEGVPHAKVIDLKPARVPSKLEVGEKIADMSITYSLAGVTTSIHVTDQECVAIENVIVPAGTFEAAKVRSKSTTTVSAAGAEGSVVAERIVWYAKGIGPVRAENRTAKGQLTDAEVLFELKKPDVFEKK